jgi:deoxyxylulose-5-phosphate synthase
LAAVEDHSLCGGFTAAVAETLADLGCDVKLHRFGVPDLFVEHMSTRREQMEAFGLTAPLLAEEWRKRVEESREAELAPRAHA